jgi:hypothetical protein
VYLHQLLDTVGHDARDFLNRQCVEASEQPAKLNDVSTVSRPTESSHQGAQGEGRGEETMEEQYWLLGAVQRRIHCRRGEQGSSRSAVDHGC